VNPAIELTSDCSRCFGLCCTAPAFAKSSDFAADKPHGTPCTNLDDDFRCGIHSTLRPSGFRGCIVFECFGAGQHLSAHTFGGVSWREDPSSAALMFDAFSVMRPLHELLAYLTEAAAWPHAEPIHAELTAQLARVAATTELPAAQLAAVDVDALRGPAAQLLRTASALTRTAFVGQRAAAASPGPDLVGADLRRADLRGASLRGALLLAADLSGADLRYADVIGADFRDANVAGADFRGTLFLTPSQLQAAQGDHATKLSPNCTRPAHWT
jgi:uncharacterized protein YjbI with pentapeptide repeats